MRYGLIGEHLTHSFSKIIHEKIMDYTYDLIPLNFDEFKVFMNDKNFSALNVTIPYKEKVLPYINILDEKAKKIGAVNTIVHKENKLYGYNTDYDGFKYLLEHNNISIKDKKVYVIGSGGASKAIVSVLKDMKAKEIVISATRKRDNILTYDEVKQYHSDIEVIVNTSPVGMYPNISDSPIDLNDFPHTESVVDIIYNPIHTKLCVDALNKKLKVCGGLEMLIAQAVKAIEYFKDIKIDEKMIDEIYREMIIDKQNIVLISMPSGGKTTIGKELSKRCKKEFIDVDEEIVKKTNMSIPEIFKLYGEEYFRNIETETIKELSKLDNKIIATGGGCIKRKENIDFLKMNGTIYFLNRDLDKLLVDKDNRPLSSSSEAVKKLYEERMPLYKVYADKIIDNNGSIEESIKQIL